MTTAEQIAAARVALLSLSNIVRHIALHGDRLNRDEADMALLRLHEVGRALGRMEGVENGAAGNKEGL
ncbi:MAG: hypothetical protein WC829_02730 [Hyphomicrobium sp.]|jgi:hypothetical protein